MRFVTPLVVAMMIAVAFAGCLAAETSGDPTISRVHTLTLSRATMEAADAHEDDPTAALRELLTTDIVVRVEEAGDYTLEYMGADGTAKTASLSLTPGTPATVPAADPLAPATLKRGDETISVRGGVTRAWWHVGDYPIGLNLTEGAKAKYAFRGLAKEALTLTELDISSQGIMVDSAAFDLTVPMEGAVSWQLEPDTGNGMPLLITGEMGIPADSDLWSLDVSATKDGVSGTVGSVGGIDVARATGSAKLWIDDGQPVAAQFLGGEVAAKPRATMWATGFFADLAEGSTECAGATKEEACVVTEMPSFEESMPAGEKETLDAADRPLAEDDEDREAIALMERLFAQDISPGDKGVVIGEADRGDTGGMGAGRFTFSVEAIGLEDVTVPAGTFQTIKIVEEMRTYLEIDSVPGPDGETLFNQFNLDETIARTTFWLDASTYEPVKAEATTPFNAEEILKRALDAVDPAAWDAIGGKPIENSQWTFTAVGESSYELVEHTPGSQFSALVGLALAHGVAGGIVGAASSYVWVSGFGSQGGFGSEAARPAMSLALTSSGAAADGLKSYTIASASPGMIWGDLMVTLDGEDSYLESAYDACAAPEMGFTICKAGTPADWSSEVNAGDVMTLVAEPGQTMRVLDPYSNSVILTLTVS